MEKEPDSQETLVRSEETFSVALMSGNLEAVQRALNDGFETNHKFRSGFGKTPLNVAAWKGPLHIAKYLIGVGANINAKDDMGNTPLHHAAQEGRSDVVRYLTGEGAFIDARDNKDRTPLHLAANQKVCKILLENGADVNEKDFDLWRPLHFAAQADNEEKILILLEYGADANAMDLDGNTPCHVAADHGNLNSLKILLPVMKENFCNGQNQTVFDLIRKNYAEREDFKESSSIFLILEDSKGSPVLLQALPEARKLDIDLLRSLKHVPWSSGDMFSNNLMEVQEGCNIFLELGDASSKELYLENLLKKYARPRIHWVDDGHSACELAVRLQNFMNQFLKEVAGIDSRFAGTVEPIGSCAEGSKLGDPNEFDFLVKIGDLAHAELHVGDSGSERLQVRLTEGEIQDRWKAFLDDENQLQAYTFSNYFKHLLWETSRRLKTLARFGFSFRKVVGLPQGGLHYPKHAVPLVRGMWSGCRLQLFCQITELSIDVDVVPAIKIQGWPLQHAIPFEQLEKLLPASVTQEETSYCIVPRDGNMMYTKWQLSFATTEKMIISNCAEPLLNALKIIKIIGIARGKSYDRTCLNSYMAKTAFLHYLASIEKDFAHNFTLTETVVKLLQIFRQNGIQGTNHSSFFMKSFFAPELAWTGFSTYQNFHHEIDELLFSLTNVRQPLSREGNN